MGKFLNSTLSHKMCPRKQTTEPKLLILVSFFSSEVTSYTDTSHCIHILREVCRSVLFVSPCTVRDHNSLYLCATYLWCPDELCDDREDMLCLLRSALCIFLSLFPSGSRNFWVHLLPNPEQTNKQRNSVQSSKYTSIRIMITWKDFDTRNATEKEITWEQLHM